MCERGAWSVSLSLGYWLERWPKTAPAPHSCCHLSDDGPLVHRLKHNHFLKANLMQFEQSLNYSWPQWLPNILDLSVLNHWYTNVSDNDGNWDQTLMKHRDCVLRANKVCFKYTAHVLRILACGTVLWEIFPSVLCEKRLSNFSQLVEAVKTPQWCCSKRTQPYKYQHFKKPISILISLLLLLW